MTYSDPSKIVKNEDELYYLYNADQTVMFNSEYLAGVTVNGQSVPLDQSYYLNGSSTQSVDYDIQMTFNRGGSHYSTFYYGNKGSGVINMHIVIKNGYDFSQGIDAVTWDPQKLKLNIYFDQKFALLIKKKYLLTKLTAQHFLD